MQSNRGTGLRQPHTVEDPKRERQEDSLFEAAKVRKLSRRARLRQEAPASHPPEERPLPTTGAEPEDDFSGI